LVEPRHLHVRPNMPPAHDAECLHAMLYRRQRPFRQLLLQFPVIGIAITSVKVSYSTR
jgi:hypothetical protein